MTTIRRKAQKLARRLRRMMPEAKVTCVHSSTQYGDSSYVYFDYDIIREKIRISDHPCGEKRLNFGEETVHLPEGFKFCQLNIWLRDLLREYRQLGGRHHHKTLPLFKTGAGARERTEPGAPTPTSARRAVHQSRHPDQGGSIYNRKQNGVYC